VLWQVAHVVGEPLEACGGWVVASYRARWQLAQSEGFPLKMPSP
jgi:hypothetical protein